MKNCTTLIAVRDMERSLRFYKDLFQQEVTLDLGWNKTLACGLALQEHFDEIAGFPADTMMFHSNTMELYFETEDFDGFIALLDQYPDVERLHEAKTFPWLQRGIRIFDPDGHLIEVSESMYCVACGEVREGDTAPAGHCSGMVQEIPDVQHQRLRYRLQHLRLLWNDVQRMQRLRGQSLSRSRRLRHLQMPQS